MNAVAEKSIIVKQMGKTTLEANEASGVRVYALEQLLSEGEINQCTHRHAFYFCLFLESGEGEHVVDFEPVNMVGHSVHFLKIGQVHSLRLEASSKGVILQFDQRFWPQKNIRPNDIATCTRLAKENFYETRDIVSKVAREISQKQSGYQDVVSSYVKILLIKLARSKSTETYDGIGLYAQQRLEEFLALVEENFVAEKSVSFYSAKMNLSNYQLSAITKTSLGKTPSMLIGELVMLEAKRRLLATVHQVSQIAHDLGFNDVSYFIRFFRKHTGVSPQAFRQNQR